MPQAPPQGGRDLRRHPRPRWAKRPNIMRASAPPGDGIQLGEFHRDRRPRAVPHAKRGLISLKEAELKKFKKLKETREDLQNPFDKQKKRGADARFRIHSYRGPTAWPRQRDAFAS